MSKDEIRQQMERTLPEYFDGYILIGRIAGSKSFLVSHDIKDHSTRSGIVLTMANAMEALAGPTPVRN